MKLLVVEDEKRLAKLIKQGLEENDFAVDLSHDGEEGLYMAENTPYDAIVLDIMLPSMDGLTILQTIRDKNIETPVLMLTARGELEDRLKGLNLGADDYITKPFDLEELIARLRSVIRRSKGKPSPMLEVADLCINTNARTVTRNGKEIQLSAREFTLLEHLAINAGRVVSRTELIEHLYDSEYDWESNVIDVYINYLRKKIDREFDRPLIHTIRGAGYVLKDNQ